MITNIPDYTFNKVIESMLSFALSKQVKAYNSRLGLEKMKEAFQEKYDVFNLAERASDRMVDDVFDFFLPYIQKQEDIDANKPTWDCIKEIVEGEIRVGSRMKYSDYNTAGLIATELKIKFNIKLK